MGSNWEVFGWLLTVARRVEGAVKQILCGMNVKTSASVANAGCLDWYREWANSH
jgi:acetoacetyl-CoA synthetase